MIELKPEVKNLTVSRVFAEKRKDVDKALDKLNKKCDRLGVSHPNVEFSNVYDHRFTDGTYEDDPFAVVEQRFKWYAIDVFDITITLPEEIKFGDWQAIAYIDHFEKQHIQFDIDADYNYDFEKIIDDKNCEHCNTIRNRRKSFVLKSKVDGSFKKVGSTCVKDFTGVDPTKFFKAFQHVIRTLGMFGEWGGFEDGSPRWVDYRVWEIEHIWTVAKKVLDVDSKYIKTEWKEIDIPYSYGYEKVRTNMGEATSDKVKKVLFEYDEESKYFVKPSEVNEKLVKGMRKWLDNMEVRKENKVRYNYDINKEEEVEVENEFDAKLKEYSERKRVRSFEIGFTGWFVYSYMKYVSSLNEPVSEFQGEIGKKIKIKATITNISEFKGYYGWTNVYKMVDSDGNIYTKFGKINENYVNTDKIKEGSIVKVTAEVKKHNEFRGKKETLLGRISKY